MSVLRLCMGLAMFALLVVVLAVGQHEVERWAAGERRRDLGRRR